MKYEVFAEYRDYARVLEFYIFRENADGRREFFENLGPDPKLRVYEQGSMLKEPTFVISGSMARPFMQEMANTLKKLGIHAEGEPVLENELTAVKYHLEDFRELVFKRRVKSGKS